MTTELAAKVGFDRFEDKEEELFVGLLLLAGRLIRQFDEVCRSWGITDDQYNVLRILRGSRPAGQPRYAIAERMMSRAPDVTRLLDRLEGKKLIVRTRPGPDRRQSISAITPEGLALLNAMADDLRETHRSIIQMLNPEEQETLRALLRRIIPSEAEDQGAR